MATLKIGSKVYGHALLVSVSSKQPYEVAMRAVNSAPVGISSFLPGFRRDLPKVHTATPLERQILGNV